MKNIYSKLSLVLLIIIGSFTSCKDENGNTVLLFSIEDDKALGAQVSAEIAADESFTLLNRNEYTSAYNYLDAMVNEILSSEDLAYRNEFAWEVTIVHDDETLNAFATPGGYIYVYTGLIKYLESADALAGVLGHEIAHADLRHTSRTLQKQYGVSILLSVLLGNDPSNASQIAAQIAGTAAGLSFSRDYETEADIASVSYLDETPYACDGAAIFFQKLEESGQTSGTPEFLSTHPSPDNRIATIEGEADRLGCSTALSDPDGTDEAYIAFQNSLPQ